MKKRIFLTTLLFIIPAILSAEEVNIYGTPFTIDAVEEIDSQLSKLTISGVSHLVTTSDIKDRILKDAIESNKIAALDSNLLKNMVLTAHKVGDNNNAADLLYFIIANKSLPDDEVILLFKNIASQQDGGYVLEGATRQILAEQKYSLTVLPEILLHTILSRPQFKPNIDDTRLSELETSLLELAKSELNLIIIQGGDGKNILNAVRAIFGNDHRTTKYITRAQDFISRAVEYSNEVDVSALSDLLAGSGDDSYLRSAIEPYMVKALHQKAKSLIDDDAPDQVLSILNYIPQNRRTPTTHELIIKSLKKVISDNNALLNSSAHSLIQSLINKDPEITTLYLEVLKNDFYRAIKGNKWSEVKEHIETITMNYPDHKALLDNLILQGAITSTAENDISLKEYFYGKLPHDMSFMSKLRLFYGGFYGYKNPIWIVTFFFLFLIAIISSYLYIHIKKRSALERSGLYDLSHRDVQLKESQFSTEERLKLEKARLLLGISADASLKEIKNAFRLAVKDLHPDTNSGVDSTDEFIRLTQAYDVILELYEKQEHSSSS